MTVDSCGERCAQLDDFKWFLPTDERLDGAIQTMMLEWLMWLLCRPVIVHRLDRTMTMNTEYGHDYDDNYGFSPVDGYPG